MDKRMKVLLKKIEEKMDKTVANSDLVRNGEELANHVQTLKMLMVSHITEIFNTMAALEDIAVIELVDNHAGVYAMLQLAKQCELYTEDGEKLDSAVMQKRFDPNNSGADWAEETLEDFYVQNYDETLWRCTWREGDIIAVNPKAEWNEHEDCWQIPEVSVIKGKCTGTCPMCGAKTYCD